MDNKHYKRSAKRRLFHEDSDSLSYSSRKAVSSCKLTEKAYTFQAKSSAECKTTKRLRCFKAEYSSSEESLAVSSDLDTLSDSESTDSVDEIVKPKMGKYHSKKVSENQYRHTSVFRPSKHEQTSQSILCVTNLKKPRRKATLIDVRECKNMGQEKSLNDIESTMKSEGNSTCPQQNTDNDSDRESDDLNLGERNLLWLVNFRVESLFQYKKDSNSPVEHDHNYKIQPTPAAPSSDPKVEEGTQAEIRVYSEWQPNNSTPIDQMSGGDGSWRDCAVPPRGLFDRYLGKPPYTYTELIELSLRDEGELTVAGIYKWITEHFPFYQASDDRWKNSIRHNLSINPNFKKGRKAQGGSHLWQIASPEEIHQRGKVGPGGYPITHLSSRFHWKKRKLDELEMKFQNSFKKLPNGEKDPIKSMQQSSAPEMEGSAVFLRPVQTPPQQLTLAQSAENLLYGMPERRVEVELVTPARYSSCDHPVPYSCFLHNMGAGDTTPAFSSWHSRGTWNMRSLHRDYSLDVLTQEFQRYELDILGLQETKWTVRVPPAEFLNPVPTTEVVEECGLEPMSAHTMFALPRMSCGSFSAEFDAESVSGEFFDVLHSWSCDKINSP